MTTFLSQKFKFFSFLSMVFLVYVHGYNLQDTYLQPWSMVQEPMTFTTFIEYLFANGLLRFRIPMLFIISGYLYALSDHKTYKERTLKRLKTLGIPYLVWSLIALGFTYALEFLPITQEAIKATGLAYSNGNLLISQYTSPDIIERTIFAPISFQFWFIRVLLVYNIAYPPIKWCVTKYPKIWFPLMFLFWFSTGNLFFIEGAGLFFFSVGVWVQKTGFDIEKAPKYVNPLFFFVLFIAACLTKTYFAFLGYEFMNGNNGLFIGILHKIAELTGFISVWYGMDSLVRWFANNKIVQYCQPFTFMIFALHVPILYYAMYLTNKYLINWQYHRMITFITIPLIIITTSILIGAILRKLSPKVYGFLTGGRGFA